MAEIPLVSISPADGSQIIKGQPFHAVVTIANDSGIKPGTLMVPSNAVGLKLVNSSEFAEGRGGMDQQLIFEADEGVTDYKITLTANDPDKGSITVTYKGVENPKLKPSSCMLYGSSTYLYDPNPVDFSGAAPAATNPYVAASINPQQADGTPLSNYDIPLVVTSPLRIFLDDGTEVSSYKIDQDKQYYYYLLKKASADAINLKIYATKGVSEFTSLETFLSDAEYSQKQIIFINTASIDVSDTLDPPIISETFSSSSLNRPDETDNFHLKIPVFESAKAGDFLIAFVSNDKDDIYQKQLSFGQINTEENGYYTILSPYDNLYEGDNYISYVALNQLGNPAGSLPNYVSYNSGGNNGPDPNDPARVLVAPELYDRFGRAIGIHQPVNINSIKDGALEVRIPVSKADIVKHITAGDSITVTAYISHCNDTVDPVRLLPIVALKDHKVSAAEIANGYFSCKIDAKLLMGYETSGNGAAGQIAVDYSRLAPQQKSVLVTRGFDTVAPHFQ